MLYRVVRPEISFIHGKELLAGEIGARSLLVGDFCEGWQDRVDWCQEFLGAKSSARDDKGRLCFVLPQCE